MYYVVFATIERKREGKGVGRDGGKEDGRERKTHRFMAQKPRVEERRKEGHKAGKLGHVVPGMRRCNISHPSRAPASE